jgi:hypothetical protein
VSEQRRRRGWRAAGGEAAAAPEASAVDAAADPMQPPSLLRRARSRTAPREPGIKLARRSSQAEGGASGGAANAARAFYSLL